MRLSLLPGFIFWAGVAHGAVVHVPLKSSLILKPNEVYTVTIPADWPTEIGWQNIQSARCTTDCVQATDVTGGVNYTVASPMGAAAKYTPVSGKISVAYRNLSSQPVTINVYRVQRTCDAEACKFLVEGQTTRWLVYKVDEFKTIATSKDGSYSTISGVTIAGRPFSVTAVWWTDNKTGLNINCSPFVKRYLDSHAPKEQYRPYIMSGQATGEGNNIVLRSIGTCAPKAPKFGVPEQNVFK